MSGLVDGCNETPSCIAFDGSSKAFGTLREWGEGWIKKVWGPAPEQLNSEGSLFGGCIITALAEQALEFAAMTMVPPNAAFRTINLQVNCTIGGRALPLCINARVMATTERLLTVRADFRRDDGKLIAEASAQQLVAEVGARARTRRNGYPFVPIYQGRDALFERPLRGRPMMGRNFQEAVKSRYPRPDLSQTFT